MITDKQIEEIKTTISSKWTRLAAEKKKFGDYRDGEGKRYDIAYLYAKIGYFNGAMRYFNWMEEEFPRDIGEPLFHFIWTVTLFENNNTEEAKRKAYKTAFSNTYLFDLLLGRNVEKIDKSELIRFETLDFARQIKDECLQYGTQRFFSWLRDFVDSMEYQENLNTFIDLSKQVKHAEPGEKKRSLLAKERAFISSLSMNKKAPAYIL